MTPRSSAAEGMNDSWMLLDVVEKRTRLLVQGKGHDTLTPKANKENTSKAEVV